MNVQSIPKLAPNGSYRWNPLPRAATQYPVLRGHIASFFVQFALKDNRITYNNGPQANFGAPDGQPIPKLAPNGPYRWKPLPRAETQNPVLWGHIDSFFVQFGLKDGQKA